jgi:hypothetical protein
MKSLVDLLDISDLDGPFGMPPANKSNNTNEAKNIFCNACCYFVNKFRYSFPNTSTHYRLIATARKPKSRGVKTDVEPTAIKPCLTNHDLVQEASATAPDLQEQQTRLVIAAI